MKSPEEIKHGLSCHMTCNRSCRGCAYNDMPEITNRPCTDSLCTDALAYIKELEAKAKLVEQYRWERDVAIDQLKQLGVAFGEKVNGKLPRWISVEERLPEDDADVLVYAIDNNENSCIAMTSYTHNMHGFHIEGWYSPWQYFFNEHTITHWMPLPEPPKEE